MLHLSSESKSKMMKRSTRVFPLFGALLLISGCGGDEPIADPIDVSVELETGTVFIATSADTIPVYVEIAETPQQRNVGLMRRLSLAADSGMIFLFETEQPPEEGFWMFNTLIPLSIAFMGEDGRIGSIKEMEPCMSPYSQDCPTYPAGVPYRGTLEVNSGFFDEHGIEVGDQVILQRD